MQRVRLAIIGAGPLVEWGLLPVLTGPDAAAPQDTGAWWSRRPSVAGEIRYQPPAIPEVVALCDPLPGGAARAEGLSRLARVPATYTDWRRMLAEVPADAVLLASGDEAAALSGWPTGEDVLKSFAAAPKSGAARWLWLDGPPARDLEAQDRLRRLAAGNNTGLWLSRPWRQAAAHRTARRLLERDSIGTPVSLQLRWPLPLDELHAYAAYAALDLLLSFLPSAKGNPARVVAARGEDDTASTWFVTTSGVTATILWAGADVWNAPWPRLEIAGTQGRSLVCEGGRRVQLYVPREATRTWEPPGAQLHVSAPNLMGIGEDLKAFLSTLAESSDAARAAEEVISFESSTRTLALWRALWRAVETGQMVDIAVPSNRSVPSNGQAPSSGPVTNLTLNLG